MCTTLFRGRLSDQWVRGKDYDDERPETWGKGVICSQLVLLFLKRCVRHGILELSEADKLVLLCTYSHTCLPKQLKDMVCRLWGAPVTLDLDQQGMQIYRRLCDRQAPKDL